jgi:hypothetical protein
VSSSAVPPGFKDIVDAERARRALPEPQRTAQELFPELCRLDPTCQLACLLVEVLGKRWKPRLTITCRGCGSKVAEVAPSDYGPVLRSWRPLYTPRQGREEWGGVTVSARMRTRESFALLAPPPSAPQLWPALLVGCGPTANRHGELDRLMILAAVRSGAPRVKVDVCAGASTSTNP